MKYRKKPVVIEAVQFDGGADSFDHIWDWMDGNRNDSPMCGYSGPDGEHPESFGIRTPEGTMTAHPGDWIIKGVKGEFYPCKDEIFKLTYDRVDEAQEATNA